MLNPQVSSKPSQGQSPLNMPATQAQGDQMGMQPGTQEPQPMPGQQQADRYDPNIVPQLEQRLNSLPQIQQAYLNHYLTPETVTILGIVAGKEVYDYFVKFTDPSKMSVIVPRNSVQDGGQAIQDDQEAENASTDTSDDGSNAEIAPAQEATQAQS